MIGSVVNKRYLGPSAREHFRCELGPDDMVILKGGRITILKGDGTKAYFTDTPLEAIKICVVER